MAQYVALSPIGIPDPDDAESLIDYERGDRLDLDPDGEDAQSLLSKGAIVPAEVWDAQVAKDEAALKAEQERFAAERRAAEEAQRAQDEENARQEREIEEARQREASEPVEELVLFEPVHGDHTEAAPSGEAPPVREEVGGGGDGPVAESGRTRPPKRSLTEMVQLRREH